MKPFKFFFAISLGMILFFFLARVLVTALVLAAVMSLVFFFFRKIKNFFQYLTWKDYQYDYQRAYENDQYLNKWKKRNDFSFNDWDTNYHSAHRVIRVH